MTKETTQGATFAAMPVADLPAATKSASPATIATGNAIIAFLDRGEAAVESTIHTDRKDAVARGSALKRAVASVAKDRSVSSRVFAVDGGYQVAIAPKVAASK